MSTPPATSLTMLPYQDLIILHKEARQKCSIYPLRRRNDLVFINYRRLTELPERLANSAQRWLLLHVDGPSLTPDDQDCNLVLIDASWRHALKLARHQALRHLPRRSLQGFYTAYPRVSSFYTMPSQGLASVEALYAARLILGREDPQLLEHYYWRDVFWQRNEQLIAYWRNRT